ncbi:MFS general substrate transporter [Penicillium longicatenatum]|uniref:MFS general substrate transporter n=1 Tax=Penicillium longicatenatum TaxID=1561947 RepID=UPI002546F921|nr:MFS general substrate transporter [Penicillium longicatenatum]KAJ5630819.1 MFS general substrate transporter [Penicillium longicatenatum]
MGNKRALLICSVSFLGNMLYGYDSIVNGASVSMPSFLLYFGSIGLTGSAYLPSIWTSLWNSMSLLCQAIGALMVGSISDRFGRKWPACAAATLTIGGTAMQYYAESRGLLLAGRMVNGLGIGVVVIMSMTYASEVAPLRLKGVFQQGLVLFYVFMMAVGLAVIRIYVPQMAPQAFRNVFAIQWAVAGINALAFAATPESPNFLISKGRLPQARNVMALIYGKNNSIDDRLAYLNKVIRKEQANKALQSGSYIECFKGVDIRRTLTVNWGGAAFLSQSIYFLIIAGLPSIHAFDVSIGGFGLAMIIIVLSWILGGKVRRRDAFMAACILNFLFMLTIGALYYAPGSSGLWGIAVLMLRAKTLSIGVITQTLARFIVPYIYNVDAGNFGARTGFVFAGLSVLLIIGTWYIVPETTGLTMEEIDKAYIDKITVRAFQTRIGSGQVEA